MKKHPNLIVSAVSVMIGILIFAAVLASRNVFSLTEPAALYSALCDAFFVPGIMLLCAGLLALVSDSGQFDLLSYAGHMVITLFTPFVRRESKLRYYEYKEMKALRRKKPRPILLVVGGIFLLLAAVCLLLYTTS